MSHVSHKKYACFQAYFLAFAGIERRQQKKLK